MDISRRSFMGAGAALFAATELKGATIQGFDETEKAALSAAPYVPFSEKKVRVGIAGEGVCSFGSAFGYQNHPNAVVVACTDLDPEKCKTLQERTKAQKTYPSCEEMIKHAAEDKLDAVYIATDAPSHVSLAIMALEHGLHVASAVPALFGADQLEYVPKLMDAVKRSGKLYMMNETTAFRPQTYAMRKIYEAGYLGGLVYTEGEYYHYCDQTDSASIVPSYKGWRDGLPPQYYPTHSNGYYTCVTHKRFTEVTCSARRSIYPGILRKNRYDNPFGAEFALFKAEDGSCARMGVAWDMPTLRGAEEGRVWGDKGCFDYDNDALWWERRQEGGEALPKLVSDHYSGVYRKEVRAMEEQLYKPQLPPGMPAGGHGGSHGYLTDDFLRGILLKDHKVCVDVITALNTTVAGIYAHLSAMKGGETLKIPSFTL